MKQDCGCCDGPTPGTPAETANRPGLASIDYRAGTYASFFGTMRARMSSADFPELAAFKTRESADFSVALLDAWAITADVLTFYQERIANEGYLSTATERRSVLELSRLIGYRPRPGVSASVFLAYEIDKNAVEVEIAAHTRAQSVPDPGEQMQTFETADPLAARFEWNALGLRMSQPPVRSGGSVLNDGLYLQGTGTQLKVNDALLIDFGNEVIRPYRVDSVAADTAASRTRVTLRSWDGVQEARTLDEIATYFSDTDRFGVKADSATAERVLKLLESLSGIATLDEPALDDILTQKVLPELKHELSVAETGGYTKLHPWIADILDSVNRFHVRIRVAAQQSTANVAVAVRDGSDNRLHALAGIIDALSATPSVPPRNALQLPRDSGAIFGQGSDVFPQILQAIRPALRDTLYGALGHALFTPPVPIKVFALRAKASLFASGAPCAFIREVHTRGTQTIICYEHLNLVNAWSGWVNEKESALALLALDSTYPQIRPDANAKNQHPENASYVLIDRPDIRFSGQQGRVLSSDNGCPSSQPDSGGTLTGKRVIEIRTVDAVNEATMSAGIGFTTKVTQLIVDSPWLEKSADFTALRDAQLLLRGTQVYAQSELLALADDPIGTPVGNAGDGRNQEIELDGLYDGLKPGRWLILSGEREDVPAAGTFAAELVMLASVRHGIRQSNDGDGTNAIDLPDDSIHTFITLARSPAYRYSRDTVVLYGNVVKADHGETRRETLGGGDGTQAFQQFVLKQPPLTYVAAPTPEGIASTLEVQVNGVRWPEADALLDLGGNDRGFMTLRDDDEKTTVIFGDGKHGARLPTGQENVQSIYRNGIGKSGNVRAQQVTLATDKPPGVKGVTNPLRASGGANPDTRDQARRNAPLAVMALDRLVSVQDHADFARTFAGIGKAAAVRLTDGHRQFVHVTIAGVDDIPIDADSDLYHNLLDAFHRYGDPHLPVTLQARAARPLVIDARVAVLPAYPWENVAPLIRNALLDVFGFDRAELGQGLFKSNVISVIQRVKGVLDTTVDVRVLDEADIIAGLVPRPPAQASGPVAPASPTALPAAAGTAPDGPCADESIAVAVARVVRGQVLPAEIAYLLPDVADTLVLELKS